MFSTTVLKSLNSLDTWSRRLYLSMVLAGVLWVVGLILHFRLSGSMAEFFIATLSLLPISVLTQMTSEDILRRLHQARLEMLSGIFRAFFGTFPELALATVALTHRDVLLAQTSLTGAFLVNCLLLIGLSFLTGGIGSRDMEYPLLIARVSSQMLLVSLISLVLPTAFQIWYPEPNDTISETTSRAGAITLLVVFGCYLTFFYITHKRHTLRHVQHHNARNIRFMLTQTNLVLAAPTGDRELVGHLVDLREKSLMQPRLHLASSLFILIVSCCLCVGSSIFVISSKNLATEALGISKSFVGLVMVPLILSAPEQLSSLAHGRMKKVEWVIEESIASSIRIALFILPLLVILGWILGIEDMTLFFDAFQITIISLTVILVNYLIHGDATWFEGVILLCTYALFANAAWHYPK